MANQHQDKQTKMSYTTFNEIRKSSSSSKIPTPLDFDRFIPWLMLEMQSSVAVSVKRVDQGRQEEYTQKEPIRRYSGDVNKMLKQLQFSGGDSVGDMYSKCELNTELETEAYGRAIRITAFYDHLGYLTEIAFDEHPMPIHRQVLKAIALCLPFHKMLTKLSIRRRTLDCGIIYEISKLLPFSKLTDICLDHCQVPEENFYILLDHQTVLKHLSLSDCNIGDQACRGIAARIEDIRPASKNLRVLNLSWNRITNAGAEALGRCLRTNRRLLHLNLCNNTINSIGAAHILLPLCEFPLFPDEIIEYRHRKLQYVEEKLKNADRCLKYIMVKGDADDLDTHQQRPKDPQQSKKKRSSREGSVEWKAKFDVQVTDDPLKFVQSNDVFHPSNIKPKDGTLFSIGNLVLCSLNLAYNNLDFAWIEKLVGVLSYQEHHRKGNKRTGLLRVVIEGNDLPVSCDEYELINMYLKRSVKNMTPTSLIKKRPTAGMHQKDRRR